LTSTFRVDGCGGGGNASAARLEYHGQTRLRSLGLRTSRTQHSCGLRRPRSAEQGGCAGDSAPAGPDTYTFPAPWPFEVSSGSPPEGGVQFGRAHGRGGSSGDSSFFRGAAVGVGRTLGGCFGTEPVPVDSFVLSPFVPRPTSAALWCTDTAIRNNWARPASHPAGGLPGLPPKTPDTDSRSSDNGLSSLGLTPKAPVRRRLAGRPVA